MQRDHCHVVWSMWYISAGLSKCHLWVNSINDSRTGWTFGAAGAACWIRDSGRAQAGNLCFNKPSSGLRPPHISEPLWQQNRRFSGRGERSLCFGGHIMYACGELCVSGRGNSGSFPALCQSRIDLKEQYKHWLWLGLTQTHPMITENNEGPRHFWCQVTMGKVFSIWAGLD